MDDTTTHTLVDRVVRELRATPGRRLLVAVRSQRERQEWMWLLTEALATAPIAQRTSQLIRLPNESSVTVAIAQGDLRTFIRGRTFHTWIDDSRGSVDLDTWNYIQGHLERLSATGRVSGLNQYRNS